MNKVLLIGIIASVLVMTGAGVYFLLLNRSAAVPAAGDVGDSAAALPAIEVLSYEPRDLETPAVPEDWQEYELSFMLAPDLRIALPTDYAFITTHGAAPENPTGSKSIIHFDEIDPDIPQDMQTPRVGFNIQINAPSATDRSKVASTAFEHAVAMLTADGKYLPEERTGTVSRVKIRDFEGWRFETNTDVLNVSSTFLTIEGDVFGFQYFYISPDETKPSNRQMDEWRRVYEIMLGSVRAGNGELPVDIQEPIDKRGQLITVEDLVAEWRTLEGPLVQCLYENNVRMYSSFKCANCARQRLDLGPDLFLEYAIEIECHPEGENTQLGLCIEKGVERTPTWVQDDEDGNEIARIEGRQTADKLARMFGCQ